MRRLSLLVILGLVHGCGGASFDSQQPPPAKTPEKTQPPTVAAPAKPAGGKDAAPTGGQTVVVPPPPSSPSSPSIGKINAPVSTDVGTSSGIGDAWASTSTSQGSSTATATGSATSTDTNVSYAPAPHDGLYPAPAKTGGAILNLFCQTCDGPSCGHPVVLFTSRGVSDPAGDCPADGLRGVCRYGGNALYFYKTIYPSDASAQKDCANRAAGAAITWEAAGP